MLPKIVSIALSLDILLTCLGGSATVLSDYLPLGRSPQAQLGIILGVAIALAHIWDALP